MSNFDASTPASSPARSRIEQRHLWPAGALDAAEALQRQLSIGDRDWHALKGQSSRRAAEQLAGALVRLLASEADAASGSSGAEQALALIESAGAWLRGSQRDPGCPRPRH